MRSAGSAGGRATESNPPRSRRPFLHVDRGPAISVEEPVEGLFAMRLRRDGVKVAIRIWFGPPLEPWTGEIMDRAPRWQAQANGRYIDFDRVWPACTKSPIDRREYDHLIATERWAQDHALDSALADPRRRIDPLSIPMPF